MAINQTALFAMFPFLWFGMWLLVTTLLWWLSGWGALQEKFPDQDQAPLKRLRFQSGMLGKGARWKPWGNVN